MFLNGLNRSLRCLCEVLSAKAVADILKTKPIQVHLKIKSMIGSKVTKLDIILCTWFEWKCHFLL